MCGEPGWWERSLGLQLCSLGHLHTSSKLILTVLHVLGLDYQLVESMRGASLWRL